MRQFLTLLGLAALAALAPAAEAQAAEQVSVTFRTATAGGNFSPRNVVAVWIETGAGQFVKTIGRWAARRAGDLTAWAQASGQDTDAVMGATRSDHSGTLTVIWNMTDKTGQVVPDGSYKIQMNLADGRTATATFTLNKNGTATTQAVTSANFMSVSIAYSGRAATPGTSSGGITTGSASTGRSSTGGVSTGGGTTSRGTSSGTTTGSTGSGGTSATSGGSDPGSSTGGSDPGSSTGTGSATTGSTASVCGDGIAETGEECDSGDLGQKSCLTFGFTAGELRCSELCHIDSTGCTGPTNAPVQEQLGGCQAAGAAPWCVVLGLLLAARLRRRPTRG